MKHVVGGKCLMQLPVLWIYFK